MMDPFSIAVGTLQIAGACAQCTMTIIKLVENINTADQRIRGFYDEVISLNTTYESLNESLSSPLLTKAAKDAQRTSDTAPLWSQVHVAVQDSIKTLQRINQILDKISNTTGILKRVKSQLLESVKEGELSRLRQRIQFFNQTISLPIQMVCVMLQLEQKGISNDQQRQLDHKFSRLERTMRDLIVQLNQPSRSSTMSGSTLVVGAVDDNNDSRGKETYITFAKKILSTASAAASNRSSLSTISQPLDNTTQPIEIGTTIPQQPTDRTKTIDDWRDSLPVPDSGQSAYEPSPVAPSETSSIINKSYEPDFRLTQQHFKLGHKATEKEEFKSAEIHFRKALVMMEKHDFGDRIALQPADVVIMLAKACLNQQKYDDAVKLLTAVADKEDNIFPSSGTKTVRGQGPRIPPDDFQALTASHLLGEVYRQKGDFDEALTHADKAFVERTDKLGEGDNKTLESVQLLINIYNAKGEPEMAEAYEGLLNPATTDKTKPPQLVYKQSITEEPTAVTTTGMSPPASEYMDPATRTESTTKASRPSFGTRIMAKAKPTKPTLQPAGTRNADHRLSFTRTGTLDETFHESVFLGGGGPRESRTTRERHMSSPSTTSHERSSSYIDDESTAASSARMSRAMSYKDLEPTFQAVDNLCAEGKFDRAVKVAMGLLESYESREFIIRRDMMEKNIRKGDGRGLATTGKGYAPIHFFCEMKEERVEEVSLLIKYGVDVNATALLAGFTNSSSRNVLTPLSIALDRGHTNIVKLLLQCRGVVTDFKDREGNLPILTACRKRNYTIVSALLGHPQSMPSVFPIFWYGNSLLSDAARHCDLPLVEILLARNTGWLNSQDKFGKTPLMHAVIKSDVNDPEQKANMIKSRIQVVRKLLDAGADINLVDNRGLTARAYAESELGPDASALRSMVGEARFELGG